jgi:hypothetical protein
VIGIARHAPVLDGSHAPIRAILAVLTRVESACEAVDRIGIPAADDLGNDPTRGARRAAQ